MWTYVEGSSNWKVMSTLLYRSRECTSWAPEHKSLTMYVLTKPINNFSNDYQETDSTLWQGSSNVKDVCQNHSRLGSIHAFLSSLHRDLSKHANELTDSGINDAEELRNFCNILSKEQSMLWFKSVTSLTAYEIHILLSAIRPETESN